MNSIFPELNPQDDNENSIFNLLSSNNSENKNISQNINSIYLKKIFALFILFIAIYELYKFFKGYKREEKTHNNYKK